MARSRTTLKNALTTTVVGTTDETLTYIPAQAGAQEIENTPDEDQVDADAEDYDDVDEFEETGELQEDLDANYELNEDPDTSLVGSIYLHLLSEHNCYEALRLSDDDAIALHQQMHKDQAQSHPISDWRFRPGRALAASMRGCDTPPTTPA